VTEMLDNAIKRSKAVGSYYFPSNFGDVVVGDLVTGDKKIDNIAQLLNERINEYKDMEGIRDEDIREYWNMDDIERAMLDEVGNLVRGAMFLEQIHNGKSLDEATNIACKWHPVYGDPRDESKLSGENKPLPHELRNRVNIYIEQVAVKDPDKYKREVEAWPSFNAFVRSKIREGKI
jgi:hypothetical protein